MFINRVFACLALIALLDVPALAAPDDPKAVATRRYESPDHRVGIDLPAEWRCECVSTGASELAVRARAPATDSPLLIKVQCALGQRNERSTAFAERRHPPKGDVQRTVVGVQLEPMPHLLLDAAQGEAPTRTVRIYRVIERRGFVVEVECAPSVWDTVKQPCFDAARSLTSSLGEYPARPEGFRASQSDGYEFLVHPDVDDAAVAAIRAALLAHEARYAALHGAVPKPSSNPIVVVVTPKAALFGKISDSVMWRSGYGEVTNEGRLFAVPLVPGDVDGRTEFAERLTALFHAQCYGSNEPRWLFDGERLLAGAEARIAEPLPSIPSDLSPRMPSSALLLEEIVREPNMLAQDQAIAYVAFFRTGPQSYRAAFSAFLKDAAATGDWETAQRKHLLALDQEKLRADVNSFLEKGFKVVRPK